TRDWRTRLPITVATGNAAPTSDYVIDLTGADPELFRKSQTTLRATTHRGRLAAPTIDSVSIATTCQAHNNYTVTVFAPTLPVSAAIHKHERRPGLSVTLFVF